MLEGVPSRHGPGVKYGLGVIIRDSELGPVHGHSGWFPGYVTTMAYYPKYDVALAIQVNNDFGKGARGMNRFLDAAAAELLKP